MRLGSRIGEAIHPGPNVPHGFAAASLPASFVRPADDRLLESSRAFLG